ncbi:3D domain-containing protein [Leptolyngbya sp. 7M]|uniref:3D domain-containing protein n=1 Tax=Leptolyngbya sp. 7M TaxID=2812896 RepID=UPI001B8AC646|nr:3D domain-containing protein [Leptolyngbya sp. 7M]QYO65423.1 3D domain-containing protein [Leptolyngbya sp. 7M]
MKDLVRGGIILSLVSGLFVFVYAQTQTEDVPVIANDSQLQFDISVIKPEATPDNKKLEISKEDKNTLDLLIQNKEQDKKKEGEKAEDKKLVEKTVSSAAVGANRGRFTATAYCLRGKTASGRMVGNGVIAADPRVLKLGTKVNLGAGAYSGNYVVADTGGRIKGNKIDIWMASCAEARRFGRRTVTVHVP